MNLERTFLMVVAALSIAALPAGAQERGDSRQARGGRRATAAAPAPRQDGAQRAVPRGRGSAAPAPERRQGSTQAPRASDSRPEARSDQRPQRAVPRSNARPSYGAEARRVPPPRNSYRPSYSRPYYYARPYVRPHSYVRYRPFYFSRPYYTFRPLLSIGFSLWLGNPVPYPYDYLGSYTPRVYGSYPGGAYRVAPGVPLYGGVSFDIQPPDADLFVDGEYVGQVGDFGPTTEPLTLTPGRHLIAVQRQGFRSMEWEVTVEPGLVIPYRGDMDRY
jgi:hypothetical protein